MNGTIDSWLAFWLAELTEPPAHPGYAALFVAFLTAATVATYTFRGIPHWIIESQQSRLLRWSSAVISILAMGGAGILVLQLMRVSFVSRRVWLALVVIALTIQLGTLAIAGWRAFRSAPRPTSDVAFD